MTSMSVSKKSIETSNKSSSTKSTKDMDISATSSSSMKTTNLATVMEIQSKAAAFRATSNSRSTETQTDVMYCVNCCIMAYPEIKQKQNHFTSDEDLKKNALQQSMLELSVSSNITNTNLYFESVFNRVYSLI